MATENSSYLPVPANYVTILDLQERWMKRQREKQEELEKKQQPKHEPTLSQRRNHASQAEIAPPSTRPVAEIATQAEEFRVSGVEEPSALVDVPAVEAIDRRRENKPYRKKKKKKKKRFGVDGKGKAMLCEDAAGGGEHAAVDEVAGESVVSGELPKGGSVKAEVKAMQEFRPKIQSRNGVRAWKVAGEGTPTEKVLKVELVRVKLENNKIKSAYHPNPTPEMAEDFKKLSTQDDGWQRKGYRGGGHGRGGPSSRDHALYRGEMVWVKKGEKADDAGHDQSRS